MAAGPPFDSVDWTRPWLEPLRESGQVIADAGNWRDALARAGQAARLRNHRGLPLRFVPQSELPPAVPYEAFISETGRVPTRDNLHDFFNALIWLGFPAIKAKLNALQALQIQRASARSVEKAGRGRVRDAATIFDENGALLVSRSRDVVDTLRVHDWHGLFIDRRDAFRRDWELRLFGHALLDKLTMPYKAITAHVWPVIADADFFGMSDQAKRKWIDLAVSQQLTERLGMTDLLPLPVLGIPGWWPGQDEAFYADTSVFRSRRRPCR
jgi:hypothetical protein